MTTRAVVPPTAGLGSGAAGGGVVVDRTHGLGGHRISLNGLDLKIVRSCRMTLITITSQLETAKYLTCV